VGHPVHDYLTAHKNNTEAELQLMEVAMAEFKSQAAVTEAILQQSQSQIVGASRIGNA
jgi:hypothetical protein